jgi:hypothetical protein
MTVKRIREAVDPAELVPDAMNANKGTERGRYVLQRSMEETGPGKAPVIDRHGNIIAGNKTVEMAVELGIPIDIVQTHGDALIVHQRLDADMGDPDNPARKMALLDNLSTEDREWDAEMLARYHEEGWANIGEWWRPEQLRDMGLELDVSMPDMRGGDRRSYAPSNPLGHMQEGATKLTFPGQRFRCGNNVLVVGEDTFPGEAAVMIRAWETYTGHEAELIEGDDG